MIEVNSETDFVAKNASFQEFVKNLLKTIIANKPADVDALMASTYIDGATTVDAKLKEMIFVIGEKISIRRFVVVEGLTSTYIHGNGSIGVVVKFDVDAAVAAKAEFDEFSKNIALQIGAYTTPYLDRDSVPASVIEEEKAIVLAQMANDPKNAGKPQQILEKMVIGKLGKFYENNCLLDMDYIKDDDLKVGKYVEKTAKELGAALKIVSFERFEKGEGIQKKEENFADEIAKLAGQK
jgi:elongation factor Ts